MELPLGTTGSPSCCGTPGHAAEYASELSQMKDEKAGVFIQPTLCHWLEAVFRVIYYLTLLLALQKGQVYSFSLVGSLWTESCRCWQQEASPCSGRM